MAVVMKFGIPRMARDKNLDGINLAFINGADVDEMERVSFPPKMLFIFVLFPDQPLLRFPLCLPHSCTRMAGQPLSEQPHKATQKLWSFY